MRTMLLALALLGSTACVPLRPASADFALAIGEPGFSLVIGDVGPPPPVYYAPPVAYMPPPVVVHRQVSYGPRFVYGPRYAYGRHHGRPRCHEPWHGHDD